MVPKSIKIGGHRFQVKIVPRKVLGEDWFGQTDSKTNTIKIAHALARSRQAEVLLHECLHAIIVGHITKEEEEETIVTVLGQGLTQLIKDNPRLFTKMIAALSDRKKTS